MVEAFFFNSNIMISNKVNITIQLLPLCSEKSQVYSIVDKAINIIKSSGIKHKVCPYETVMEGDYDKIMKAVKDIQIMCLSENVDDCISNLKIHISKKENITIEDKIEKYS